MYLILLFSVIFILSALSAIYLAVSNYRTFKARLTWKKIEASVTKFEYTTYEKTDDDTVYYEPNLQYKYIVNNKYYSGSRVHFINGYGHTKEDMINFGLLHSLDEEGGVKCGDKIAVFYDPKKPNNSVLNIDVSTGTIVMIFVFLLIAIAMEIPITMYLGQL